MSYTAGDVADMAAPLLNDAAKNYYTFAIQLPYLKIANRELEAEFIANGLQIPDVTSNINVGVGATNLALPADFFVPISLQERLQSSTDDDAFVEMTEQDFEPTMAQTDGLIYWAFRNGQIRFVGSTTARTVKLFYKRTLAAIAVVGDSEEVQGALNFLGFRTAALCAEFAGGGNEARAASLNQQAILNLQNLETIYAKANQGRRVRRKPFRVMRSSNLAVLP